jgi:hypothetical protein
MKRAECRENLPDFLEAILEAPVKREVSVDFRVRNALANRKFEQMRIESTATCDPKLENFRRRVKAFWNPQASIREFASLPLFSYSEDPIICDSCGHVDLAIHDSDDCRWRCKCCGHTFRTSIDKGLKDLFPLYDVILSSFLNGDDLARTNTELRKEADRRDLQIRTISSEAEYSIVERADRLLACLEPISIRKFAKKEVILKTVEMDYTCYPIYTLGSKIKQLDLKNRKINFHNLIKKLDRRELERLGVRKRAFVYITGVLDVESRYSPPMVTDYSFDYRRSLKCLDQMITTVGCKPHDMRCDGAQCHRKAIRIGLPDVFLYTKTKAEYYAIVAHLERLWDEFKDESLLPYRFMSLRTVRLAVDFKRLEHFFVRPHTSLNENTPAEFLGICIPRSITRDENEKWQKLLKLAHRIIRMEKLGDLPDFL